MLLPEATRAWREGVPTVIVMETGYDLDNTSKAFQKGITSHLETFADYPDLTDRSFKLGDMRYTTHIHTDTDTPTDTPTSAYCCFTIPLCLNVPPV